MTALPELVCGDVMRSVMVDEAPGVYVNEVLASTMLESVTSDRRHPHSFAASALVRSGDVVEAKLNAAAVLRREVRRRSWRRETVALGVDDDPYQAAEEHYRLMPQMLSVLAESQTPIALYTSSDLVMRDAQLLRLIRHVVPVTVSVSLGTLDPALSKRLDPAASSPAARLRAIAALADAGLEPRVSIEPLAPFLADGTSALEALLSELADAGTSRVSVRPLQLDGDGGAQFLNWIGDEHPALLRRYRSLYGKRTFVSAEYSASLRKRMAPLVERYGLGGSGTGDDPEPLPAVPIGPTADEVSEESLTLF